MGKFISLLFAAAMTMSSATTATAAEEPVHLFAPFSTEPTSLRDIPDGYFEPVTLDIKELFAYRANSMHEIVLPHLGRFAVEHDRTEVVDFGGNVTRWEGHVAGRKSLKVTFVKGVSGMVSGIIDTPRGRVLLGQAGNYIVYKQGHSSPSRLLADPQALPQALSVHSLDPNSQSGLNKPADVAYPVDFNAAALANVPLNGEVEVSLPGAGSFRVVHDNTLPGDMGATTFVGYLKDFGNDYRMIVTYSPSGAQGQVLTPYGMYLIKTIDSQQWLIDVNGSNLHHVVPRGNDGLGRHDRMSGAVSAGEDVQTGIAGAATTTTVTSKAVTTGIATTTKTRIDLLVVYTPGMENVYGSVNQVQTRIQYLVALANQAYIDSGVDISLHLVGAVKIDAPDYSSNLDTLNAITDGSGPFNNVAWSRNAYGADLVSLVRPFSMRQGGLCGISWVGGANGNSIARYRDQGYSVVSDGNEGGYYCSAYTFVHELGHNMGNVHDRATVARQNGSSGAYSYSYGYGIDGEFGTIMSYIDPEVGKFSNPDKLCKGQSACGITETDTKNSADNTLSLNNTRSYIAAYTPEASAAERLLSIAGVVTVDGKALSGVKFNTSAPATCSDSGENGSFSCIVSYDWSGDITPSLAGYSFSPPSITVNNLNDNIVDQNFTAVRSKELSLATAASQSSSSGGGALGFEVFAMAALLCGLRRRRIY